MFEQNFERRLAKADIRLNGDRPWDIRINDSRVFFRVMLGGVLALGESYMDGWWDCDDIAGLVDRVYRNNLNGHIRIHVPSRIQHLFYHLSSPFFNWDWRLVDTHYNRILKVCRFMLGDTMVYSCGYWRQASTLQDAQIHKMQLVCEKAGLEPGMDMVEVGLGYGTLARFAAEYYGVRVVGITTSEEQAGYARELCAGFPVEVHVMHYKDLPTLNRSYDAALSVGMFEAVPRRRHTEFNRTMFQVLRHGGIFTLHSIVRTEKGKPRENPWINKYIFPGGYAPSANEMRGFREGALAQAGFRLTHDEAFPGSYYERTLLEWYRNFEEGWPTLKDEYGEQFRRMWRLYLLSCAGAFRAEHTVVHQVCYQKKFPEKYALFPFLPPELMPLMSGDLPRSLVRGVAGMGLNRLAEDQSSAWRNQLNPDKLRVRPVVEEVAWLNFMEERSGVFTDHYKAVIKANLGERSRVMPLVALAGSRVVGMLTVAADFEQKNAFAFGMVIDARHRNHGVEDALLQFMEEAHKSNGYPEVCLIVPRLGSDLSHYFLKRGYRKKSLDCWVKDLRNLK